VDQIEIEGWQAIKKINGRGCSVCIHMDSILEQNHISLDTLCLLEESKNLRMIIHIGWNCETINFIWPN
jgi:hypothetical protein